MTEAEWLACEDPELMLNWLAVRPTSERKMRLFLAACARLAWDRMPWDWMHEPTEIAERFADGTATRAELSEAHKRYFMRGQWEQVKGRDNFLTYTLAHAPTLSERMVARPHLTTHWPGLSGLTADRQPGLLRDIIGHPVSSVAVDPRWQTNTVRDLAATMYESRDFTAMPILADALEEAGCDNPDVLAHCRGDGPHVRGCWVVDLILGKG